MQRQRRDVGTQWVKQLISNVVLISAVQLHDSITHIYTFFKIFFPIMVYPRRLDTDPCAIQ